MGGPSPPRWNEVKVESTVAEGSDTQVIRPFAPTPRYMRAVLAALALALLLAAPADARLRPVGKLKAKATATTVKLTWRDRSRGETRYVVRRTGRTAKLKRNRHRFTDRRVKPGHKYRYSVRACRKQRCAKARRVTCGQRRPAASARAGAGGGGGAPGSAFAGSPTIGGCPIFPNDNPWNTDVSQAPVDTSHDYIGSLGSMTLWPDFGGDGAYGIPYVSVPFTQPLVPISFESPTSPIPAPTRSRPTRPWRAAATATCCAAPGRLQALRALRRGARGRRLARLQRRGLGPEVERAAPRALDVRRRRRPADPARARAPRRGRRRRDQPRAAHHRADDAEGLHPPGHPLGLVEHRPQPAADGPARAAEGELRHQRPARPGAARSPRR